MNTRPCKSTWTRSRGGQRAQGGDEDFARLLLDPGGLEAGNGPLERFNRRVSA